MISAWVAVLLTVSCWAAYLLMHSRPIYRFYLFTSDKFEKKSTRKSVETSSNRSSGGRNNNPTQTSSLTGSDMSPTSSLKTSLKHDSADSADFADSANSGKMVPSDSGDTGEIQHDSTSSPNSGRNSSSTDRDILAKPPCKQEFLYNFSVIKRGTLTKLDWLFMVSDGFLVVCAVMALYQNEMTRFDDKRATKQLWVNAPRFHSDFSLWCDYRERW